MKKVKVVFARQAEYLQTLSESEMERTAKRDCGGTDFDVVFQTWPNRASMAKSIRMQESREPKPQDWRAVRPLSPTEGF